MVSMTASRTLVNRFMAHHFLPPVIQCFEDVVCVARVFPKIPFLGLCLLANPMETLVTRAIEHLDLLSLIQLQAFYFTFISGLMGFLK